MNKIENCKTIQKVNETKWVFKGKIDKLLTILKKEKKKNETNHQCQKWIQDFTTDSQNIKGVIRNYYKQKLRWNGHIPWKSQTTKTHPK